MTGVVAAMMAGAVPPCFLSGSLNATASAGTANSSVVTVTVPPGNSGQIRLGDFVTVGTVGLSKYNKNSAGLTTFSDPTTVTFSNGDTLLVQTLGDDAGESRTFTLTDISSGLVIGVYVHTGA